MSITSNLPSSEEKHESFDYLFPLEPLLPSAIYPQARLQHSQLGEVQATLNGPEEHSTANSHNSSLSLHSPSLPASGEANTTSPLFFLDEVFCPASSANVGNGFPVRSAITKASPQPFHENWAFKDEIFLESRKDTTWNSFREIGATVPHPERDFRPTLLAADVTSHFQAPVYPPASTHFLNFVSTTSPVTRPVTSSSGLINSPPTPSPSDPSPNEEIQQEPPHQDYLQQHSLSFRKRFCLVCGDTAVNQNFGRLTCESCKAFFRRNAFKDGILRCIYGKQCCGISVTNRKQCPACRLVKCFHVGMDRSLIQIRKNAISRQNSTASGRLSSHISKKSPSSLSPYVCRPHHLSKASTSSSRSKKCSPSSGSSLSQSQEVSITSSQPPLLSAEPNSTSLLHSQQMSYWHCLFQRHFRNACFFNVAEVPLRATLHYGDSGWPLEWSHWADLLLRPVHDMVLDMSHLEDVPVAWVRALLQRRLLFTLPMMQAACCHDWKGLRRVPPPILAVNPAEVDTLMLLEVLQHQNHPNLTYTHSLRAQGYALSSLFSPETQVFTRLASFCRNLADLLHYQPALFLLCFLLKLLDLPEADSVEWVQRKRTQFFHLFHVALLRLSVPDAAERVRVMQQMLEWSRVHLDPFLQLAFTSVCQRWAPAGRVTPFISQLCSAHCSPIPGRPDLSDFRGQSSVFADVPRTVANSMCPSVG